ncbi:hypothetical protein BSKO_13951 [Bryopsis sp. KO-2023]|nr:hypothetical protein BSKO_13951 [Bryopsis sp. KO-2023]
MIEVVATGFSVRHSLSFRSRSSRPPHASFAGNHRSKIGYDALCERAREKTLAPPSGQLYGRAGRRSVLEDGERMLLRCITMKPNDLQAYELLAKNLSIQNRGRELEIPSLAIEALKQCGSTISMQNQKDIEIVTSITEMSVAAIESNDRVESFLKSACKFAPDFHDVIWMD